MHFAQERFFFWRSALINQFVEFGFHFLKSAVGDKRLSRIRRKVIRTLQELLRVIHRPILRFLPRLSRLNFKWHPIQTHDAQSILLAESIMKPWLVNFVSTVQLTRLANAFAGVANLWFVVLWCRSHQDREHMVEALVDMPLSILLGLTAVIGIGLSTYAGSLNDLFDLRKDQALAPDRPLASGRISPQTAAAIGFSSLLLSIVGALVLGPVPSLICLISAALILVYNVVARHIPGLGFVTIAAIYGIHMLTVNLGLRFIWPVYLIMVHATIVHATVYHLEKKRPRITVMTIIGTIVGLAALGIALEAQAGSAGVSWGRVYRWYGLSWPLAAAVVFTVTAINKVRFSSSGAYAAEKLQRYGSLWMGIFGLSWLLGAGLYFESIFLGVLVLVGVLWMALIRDLGAWIEQPIGYRW